MLRLAKSALKMFMRKRHSGDPFLWCIVPLLWVAIFGNIEATYAAESGANQPDRVFVAIGLMDLDAVSSADQSFTVNLALRFRWRDPALAHNGTGHVRRQLNEISAPNFVLINQQKTFSTLLDVVDISPAGEAVLRIGNINGLLRVDILAPVRGVEHALQIRSFLNGCTRQLMPCGIHWLPC